MELREYQKAASQAVIDEWDLGVQNTLEILPTGTGKTIVVSDVIRKMAMRGKRGLILAHRDELLRQAAEKLNISTGLECAREKADETALNSWLSVTVGSVQTLMRQSRLERFSQDYYDYIIIDEAHHALSESYRRILAHFKDAKVLGVTATPDRGDMRNLGELFETKAYEYLLPQAIKEGYLCKIKALTIPLQIDLSHVSTQAGDFKASDIDGAIGPYLDAIANEMQQHCKGRKTVVFLPLIHTSQRFASMLSARGFRAGEVNGESPDRESILKSFHDGKFDVLCNSMLLTEGWDEPAVDCIIPLRPTKIRSLYAQIVGRGTRPFPGKDNLLLLDFLWLTGKHSLCHPANLICQNQELADAITQILAEERNASGMDLEEAIQAGEGRAALEREDALAKALDACKRKKRDLVDPVALAKALGDSSLTSCDSKSISDMAPPTMEQVKELELFNVYVPDVQTRGAASRILDRLRERQQQGLSSTKQVNRLTIYGFKDVAKWRFEEARKMCDRLAVNRWSVPPGVSPANYKPESLK